MVHNIHDTFQNVPALFVSLDILDQVQDFIPVFSEASPQTDESGSAG